MKKDFKLKILGYDVPVIYQDDLAREYDKGGHYDAFKKQIKICSDINEQSQSRVLLHEILEVINAELHLQLKHDEQIDKLDTALYQVLKDNREIFDRIK